MSGENEINKALKAAVQVHDLNVTIASQGNLRVLSQVALGNIGAAVCVELQCQSVAKEVRVAFGPAYCTAMRERGPGHWHGESEQQIEQAGPG